VTILIIAAIAAVGLAFVLAVSMKHKTVQVVAASDPTPHAVVQVLVAKHDLAIGTRLANGDLAWQAWPANAVNAAFITDGHGEQTAPATATAAAVNQVAKAAATSMSGGGPMEALYGAMVRAAILANEPISSAKLLRAGEGGFMSVVLKPGMRAISIPVTVSTGAGGFVLPGDRVDLVQARPVDPAANGGRPGFTVAEVLRDVRVLAIDQSIAPAKDSETIVGAVATLEVPDEDAKTVALAKAQGEIMLALRPFGDNGATTAPGAAAPPAPPKVVAVQGASVRVFRAGVATEVAVAP
jgi:pilus assembly protein CpaB